MNEAIFCGKCGKNYFDHDLKNCKIPDWKDEGDIPELVFEAPCAFAEKIAEIPEDSPNYMIFYQDGKEVGKITLTKDVMHFDGKLTESAKILFDLVKKFWEQLPPEQKQ